jgi:hypothetical protein
MGLKAENKVNLMVCSINLPKKNRGDKTNKYISFFLPLLNKTKFQFKRGTKIYFIPTESRNDKEL